MNDDDPVKLNYSVCAHANEIILVFCFKELQ